MKSGGKKHLKKVLPGAVGLLISGLMALAALSIEQKNDKLTDRILSAQFCGYKGIDQPWISNTPECIDKSAKIPTYEKEKERGKDLIEGLYIGGVTIAAFSGASIFFAFLQNIFVNHIAPASKKIKVNYDVDKAVKQIEKYQKLLESGVMTQDQFDRKAKELQKLVAD